MDIVAHAEFVAIIEDRRPHDGEQQRIHQFDTPPVVFEQRGEPAPDAEIEARPLVGRVSLPEVVALLVGDHLQRQFVMVAQERRPLAVRRCVRRLPHDVHDREAVLLRDRHIHARHQREVEQHVALVAVAEIGLHVLRPLVGFGKQHAAGIVRVDLRADALQNSMRLRQVLVVGALALDQIGHRVEAQPVDADLEPEAHDRQRFRHHGRIVEIEIGLMRVETMPVIGPRLLVPGPVRFLGIEENDARAGVAPVGVGPDVKVALRRSRRRLARALEPGVLVRRVVEHKFGDHAHPFGMRQRDEAAHVVDRAIVGMDAAIVRDVVAVVAPGRWIKRQEPDRSDAQFGEIVELVYQALKIADAVIVGIGERLDMELVDDRVLVPERIVGTFFLQGLIGAGEVQVFADGHR
ncbi:MAG: hypothetical protein WDN03_06990 [Rhizomicrobium sp.]